MSPTTAVRDDLSSRIRDLTPDEQAAYRDQGWVYAPGFIDPDLCAEVLEHFKAWNGIHWDRWPDEPTEQQAFLDAADAAASAGAIFTIRQSDPWMFDFVAQRQFGKAAAELIGCATVRPVSETIHMKFPASSGHSRALGWHQDLPYIPIDRAGAVQTWITLAPMTVEMGPMVHLTGSHREPPLGMLQYAGDDPLELYPYLLERYTESEPHGCEPGDVVFHHPLTFHRSSANETDRVRWAMSSYRMDGRALYTGQQNYNTDGLGLEPNKPFDHPNFPIVYDADADA